MRILVTGGKGFIGSHIVEKLIIAGHQLAIYDSKTNFIDNQDYYRNCLKLRKKIFKGKPELDFKGDIREINKFKNVLEKFKPEIVVHLAGLPMARAPEKHISSMIPINLHGTLNVLEAFENSSYTKRIVYISSSMAYGHFIQNPQTENAPLRPINLYGSTKAAGEHFVRLSRKEWVIVRPTSVYGFTDCANRVTQLLIDAAFQNKKAWIVKGESLDFSYVNDVADGLVKCSLSPKAKFETFNLSRGQSRLAAEFAEILKKYFPSFEYEIREPTNQQVWRGALDISKAKKLLGFNPKYNIEDGIKDILSLMKLYKWKETFYEKPSFHRKIQKNLRMLNKI